MQDEESHVSNPKEMISPGRDFVTRSCSWTAIGRGKGIRNGGDRA